ncbi:IPPc domain-containing protein [Aphelenchoides besseyi]|nr:IPPc domain-containing protein [Aphelenchoides besseyi]KAI6217369.1 IPPc domain-containing protein [Aphelenchoides besseyi]
MSFKSEFFIDDLLHEHEHRFCSYEAASVFVTTFNVNGRSPPEYLGNWLHFDTNNFPDFVVIGLQEMDLALGQYVVESSNKHHEWLFVLKRALPNFYVQVDFIRLIGIFLVLYRRQTSRFAISEVVNSAVPTGFLKFGNKGGVGISLQINDSLVCFINSHLAAGNGELARRNQDFRDISQMQFQGKGIYDHDVVIWLGDLNYRLNAPMMLHEIVAKCDRNEHRALFQMDQLREQQREKTAFNGFHELEPSFKPTYKYDCGTSNWDSSEKRRVPAWCDRILYWTRDKNVRVKQCTYNSCPEVVFSDHKPVVSFFSLNVKKIDKQKRATVQDEILKETDKRANNLLPQISLSKTEFDMGTVSFDKAAVAVLTIRNTGASATRFHFASKHQQAANSVIGESWLTMTPNSSFLDVDAEVTVTLQVCVNKPEAAGINAEVPLGCILVIRLDKGRDYFVVVSAKYSNTTPPTTSNGDDEEWLINFDETPRPK